MNHPFWGTPTCIFDLKTIFDNLDELPEHDGQVKPQKYTKKISLFKKMVYDFSNYLEELSYFTNLNSSASYGDDPPIHSPWFQGSVVRSSDIRMESSVAPDAAGCDDLIAIRTKLHLEADMANRNPATVGWKNGGFNGTKMIYIYHIYIIYIIYIYYIYIIYIHIYTVPHLRHEMGLEMWSAVDWDGCFVKLSRSKNFVPPELFSGNCQVGCCLLLVLQLGHHTPHKISVSSGFKAFLCSTLTFFIVAMASHLQLCSIEDFGKRPYSFLQCYTCAVTHW